MPTKSNNIGGKGGARNGAGRKPKPAIDKLAEGNGKTIAKEKIYLAMEAQGTMTTELAHQHNLIIDEVLALEKRKRQITKHNIEVVTRNNNITLCDELLKKYDKMETFDEEVFNQMVEQIVVMGKNRLLYKFKNGYTADIEVIDYYLERDEIGEVQIYASTKC